MRHTALRLQARDQARKSSWWYGAGGALAGGLAGAGVSAFVCPSGAESCASTLIGAGTAAGIQQGLLFQKYRFLAHSRENELDADRIGFQIATRAGYSASHVGSFYSRLQKFEEESRKRESEVSAMYIDSLRTHPSSAERVAQLKQLISLAPSSAQATVSTDSFERAQKRIRG